MYCYNCGQKVYNHMQKCPCCNQVFDEEKIENFVFNRTINKIANECLIISKPHKKSFRIGAHDLSIEDEMYVLCHINRFVNALQNDFKSCLLGFIKTYSLSDLTTQGENFLLSKFNNVAYASFGFLYANGIQISIEETKYMQSIIARIPFIWQPVYEIASEFEELSSLLQQQRNAMNTPRAGKWIGGGIGIRGAIKGQIKADILNAGGTMLNSAGNAIKKGFKSIADSEKLRKAKKEITESPEFLNSIFSESNKFFDDIREYLLSKLCDDNEKCKNIKKQLSNIKKHNTFGIKSDVALKNIANNPFIQELYVALYKSDRNNGEGLCLLADFCGIKNDILDKFMFYVDNDIFENEDLNLHSVGYDTGLEELIKIKKVLVHLETNNPGFLILSDSLYSKEEQKYHKKVDELINLKKSKISQKIIEEHFNTYSKNEAIKKLIEKKDKIINDMLIDKFDKEIKEIGVQEFLQQFEGYYPHVVTISSLINANPKILKNIKS